MFAAFIFFLLIQTLAFEMHLLSIIVYRVHCSIEVFFKENMWAFECCKIMKFLCTVSLVSQKNCTKIGLNPFITIYPPLLFRKRSAIELVLLGWFVEQTHWTSHCIHWGKSPGMIPRLLVRGSPSYPSGTAAWLPCIKYDIELFIIHTIQFFSKIRYL